MQDVLTPRAACRSEFVSKHESSHLGPEHHAIGVVTIDERLEKLAERHEALTLNVELLTRDLETLRAVVEKDAENIRALARIAEIH
jgi:hypothetical protein